MGKKTHYRKNVFEHFWREINNFIMDCTIIKKPPSQTLLDYSVLSSELSGIIIVCTPFLLGGGLSLLLSFQKGGLDRISVFRGGLPLNFSRVFFFLIGINPMQGWTASTRHGVTRKKSTTKLQDTKNLFRKNLQLNDVC